MSIREIAQASGFSDRTVRKWIARNNANEDADPLKSRPRAGRPRKSTAQEDLNITNFALNNPFTNSVLIKEELKLTCSTATIRQRLHDQQIHARAPAKKTELTPAQAEARLPFAHENINRDWSRVIFSDEKPFSSSIDTPKWKVWRPNNTRYNNENVRPNRASGRISLGYWDWISRSGPGEIVQITPPKFNAQAYINVLEDVYLPSVRTIYPEDEMPEIVLVQDNCSIHRANVV